MQDTGSSEVTLRGIYTTRTEDGSQTQLTAHLLVGGNAATLLEALVARLSVEPGVHDVHWHSADEPNLTPAIVVSHD